jgi:hypothetical protein
VNEREQFEKAMHPMDCIRRGDDTYADAGIRLAWFAWQAARTSPTADDEFTNAKELSESIATWKPLVEGKDSLASTADDAKPVGEAFYDGASNEPVLMWVYDGYKPAPNHVVLIAATAQPAKDAVAEPVAQEPVKYSEIDLGRLKRQPLY